MAGEQQEAVAGLQLITFWPVTVEDLGGAFSDIWTVVILL